MKQAVTADVPIVIEGKLLTKLSDWWSELPELLRIILRRAALSSFVLIIVSQLATHWYALKYGARIPLEGVPFLIVMSIVASALLTLVSAATLLFIPLALSQQENHLHIRRRELKRRFVHRKLKKRYGNSLGSVLSWGKNALVPKVIASEFRSRGGSGSQMVGSFILWSLIFGLLLLILRRLAESNQLSDGLFIAVFLSTLFILMALMGMLSFGFFSEAQLRRISQLIYFFAVFSLSVLMMGPLFEHILRVTRYGGGIEVNIQTIDQEEITSAGLFLVSSDSVTVWRPAPMTRIDDGKDKVQLARVGRFEQISSSQIIAIKYEQYPEPLLPKQVPISRVLDGF